MTLTNLLNKLVNFQYLSKITSCISHMDTYVVQQLGTKNWTCELSIFQSLHNVANY